MALANRKSENIFNKNTGGDVNAKTISSSKETEIKSSFDNGDHVLDQGMFENLAPALYAIQQLTEDIEELRRFVASEITSITTSQANAITANTAKTGISTSQASAITANTAKVSQGLTTANTSMSFDVKGDPRSGYSLNILVTCNDGVTRAATLTLR